MKLFKALVHGGPVGLAHAAREAWIAHRISQVSKHLDIERDLHREHTAQLQRELKHLMLRQANVTQRATTFWRAMSS